MRRLSPEAPVRAATRNWPPRQTRRTVSHRRKRNWPTRRNLPRGQDKTAAPTAVQPERTSATQHLIGAGRETFPSFSRCFGPFATKTNSSHLNSEISECGVEAAGEHVHRAALRVVGRIGNELIVDADFCRRRDRVAVIS